ncbi:MAG: 50S ribosomal protein L10 [Oscillospiraceae bacterium]
MPSKSVLEQKQAYVADLAEKLRNAAGGVLVDYKGISVEADTKLRKDLRENGVEYFVVKNTLLKRAAEIAGIEGLEPALSGTTAIALSAEDIIIAPKLLFKQTGTTDSTFAIKPAIDGKVISKEEVEACKASSRRPCSLSSYSCFSLRFRVAIALNEIAKKNEEQSA